MTSSLVGSEMCIRDSHQYCSLGYGWLKYGTPPKRRSRKADVWAHRLVAVSYTHLTLPTICSV
eukprot:7481911-Prorocentrum_lima.AAC.1